MDNNQHKNDQASCNSFHGTSQNKRYCQWKNYHRYTTNLCVLSVVRQKYFTFKFQCSPISLLYQIILNKGNFEVLLCSFEKETLVTLKLCKEIKDFKKCCLASKFNCNSLRLDKMERALVTFPLISLISLHNKNLYKLFHIIRISQSEFPSVQNKTSKVLHTHTVNECLKAWRSRLLWKLKPIWKCFFWYLLHPNWSKLRVILSLRISEKIRPSLDFLWKRQIVDFPGVFKTVFNLSKEESKQIQFLYTPLLI